MRHTGESSVGVVAAWEQLLSRAEAVSRSIQDRVAKAMGGDDAPPHGGLPRAVEQQEVGGAFDTNK